MVNSANLDDSFDQTPASYKTSTMSKDDQTAFCLFESFGLLIAISAVVLLILTSPGSVQSIGIWNGGVPAVFFSAIVATVVLALSRFLAKPLSTETGGRLIFVLAITCGGVAPFGMLYPTLWIIALPLTTVGCVAVLFIWWSKLNVLGHRILVSLVSYSFVIAAVIVLTIGMFNLEPIANTAISSCLIILSGLLSRLLHGKDINFLPSIDALEHERQAKAPFNYRIGSFNYVVTGLIVGVSISLVFIYLLFGDVSEQIPKLTFLFAVAMILAGILLLVFRYLFEFLFERVLKEFKAVFCLLGLMFLPFVSYELQCVCFVFLMVYILCEVLVIITAVIERARFEEVSPLWYVGELAYLFGGLAMGILMAWILHFEFLGSWSLILCCFITIIIVSLSQIIVSKVRYPTLELYDESTGSTSGSIRDTSVTGQRVKYWKQKLLQICREYNLSPRQSEVLEMLAKGRDINYLTTTFYISKSTAKTHVANIYHKLDIHSRQELLDMIDSIYIPDERG